MKDLDRALQEAFNSTKGFPKFKKKFKHDSFRFPQGTKLDGDKIYLPKIGWVRFRKSREIEGTIKNVTVSKTLDKWYVSIQTESEVSEPVHPSKTVVGIDLGVVRFATFSDGTIIQPINIFRMLEPKLASEQRKLARKIKLSNNWIKQKTKIQKLHHKIANVRLDFLHIRHSTVPLSSSRPLIKPDVIPNQWPLFASKSIGVTSTEEERLFSLPSTIRPMTSSMDWQSFMTTTKPTSSTIQVTIHLTVNTMRWSHSRQIEQP